MHRHEYHPFTKFKLIAWLNYWKPIAQGKTPPPIAVSVDPINACNHRCVWCNSAEVLGNGKDSMMSREFLMQLAPFLGQWGVKAICVGGGGEPLLNPFTGSFIIECVKNGMEVGVVTNGTNLEQHVKELSLCRWVGVSVDAATHKTHARLHKPAHGDFPAIVSGLKKLVVHRKKFGTPEVTYKFLLHPENLHELFTAAKLAKKLEVNVFHARPAGETWFNLRRAKLFSRSDISLLNRQMTRLQTLASDTFRLHCVTARNFTKTLDIKHDFTHCAAVFMTCVFQPGGVIGLCCDRRGDDSLTLARVKNPRELLRYWGGARHKRIARSINLTQCPRCTYASHNEIFESAVETDSMCVNFI